MSGSNNNPTGGKPTTGQKLKGAAKVVHGIGDNWRGHVLNAFDGGAGGAAKHPETERGRLEVEQGMAMLTGEAPPTTANTGDRSQVGNQQYTGGAGVGAGEGAGYGYGGGVAGAGTGMPINAALGAGAGGAYPEAQYAASPGYSTENRDASIRGRNDREFERGKGFDASQQDSLPPVGSPGPAPDHTYTGQGTGVPASGIQRLP